MSENEKEIIRDHLDEALSAMTEALFAKGQLDRVEDLECSLWFGELHSVLMHLTTLLFESGVPIPEVVYAHIAKAGQMLNASGSKHRTWTWERLSPQGVSGSA
jgi:hypothetical protein